MGSRGWGGLCGEGWGSGLEEGATGGRVEVEQGWVVADAGWRGRGGVGREGICIRVVARSS